MNIKLTVFFSEPFWVGVFERINEGMIETSKVVFGTEPKDYEVYLFIIENYYKLQFGGTIKAIVEVERKINPKRLQRIIKRETTNSGIGTMAQQAMKLEHEVRKFERKQLTREKREELEEVKFKIRQDKKKEKKKGH